MSEIKNEGKPLLYFDMDGVLVDFQSGIDALQISDEKRKYCEEHNKFDEEPGIFGLMQPTYGAVRAIKELARHYELHILSTAPWNNPTAWSDKLLWVKKHFDNTVEANKENKNTGNPFYKRITISHRKDRVFGAVLVEDNLSKNGADGFKGEKVWFHFDDSKVASCPEELKASGVKEAKNWYELLSILMPKDDTSWMQYKSELVKDSMTKQ